jgi:uncharacterized protein YdiU (UPF0061 family)
MRFDNTYLTLPEGLFRRQVPTPVRSPRLVLFNHALATGLGIDSAARTDAEWASLLSGNSLPPGAEPIAQAYAGHQFGHFNMLGDGRAILLGEVLDPEGRRFDLQLKGSGRTPYSRRGDGRATLSSMLREYLVSEAMFHLGIPTTRSLAVVATGEAVYRERTHDGAVLTRVASSHIRVGTFEYARNIGSQEELSALAEHAISRHYPDLGDEEDRVFRFFEAVMDRQLDLIVHWMRIGFIHGVMNTDNMSVSGETIDYGPCAFMNAYRPDTVFSSIDTQGRYAYANQPRIAQWNLAVLAGALLPLMTEPEEKAVQRLEALLEAFPSRYLQRWLGMMGRKLGLTEWRTEDRTLVDGLLAWMADTQADWTSTFVSLMGDHPARDLFGGEQQMPAWFSSWQERAGSQPGGWASAKQEMRRANPVVVPRNHLVEEALQEAVSGNPNTYRRLMDRLASPYSSFADDGVFRLSPPGHDVSYRTFCGT